MQLERVVHDLPRLSRAQVRQLYPHLTIDAAVKGQPAPDYVIRAHTLPRGSVIVEDPDVEAPFACQVQVYGHHTYAVVARERGDVEYPAYLKHMRSKVPSDVARIVRERMGDVLDWLEESRRRLAWVGKDPDTLDEHSAALYYAAVGNGKVTHE